MRLAVLSDIHGNLIALETVLADLEAQGGADMIWCLGDLAAFGSRAGECISRIRLLSEAEDEHKKKKFKTIGGNTDRYLLTGESFPQAPAKDEAELAKQREFFQQWQAIMNWNRAQISWEDYEFMKKIQGRELWQEIEDYGTVIGYHAVPGNDESFLKPDTPLEEAADFMLDREGRLGIGGHTHIQMNREVGRWILVNVGSVGLSADNPGYAQYGIFTFDQGILTVNLRNVAYDVDSAIEDLEITGHPVPNWITSRIRPAKTEEAS